MTKLKKLLLTLAPISAVMIATPIILTSCSTNSETQNNGGSSGDTGIGGGSGNGGNGSGGDTGNGGGSGGSGGENTNPTLTADSTNSKNFKPTTENGLFLKVEDVVKKGKPNDDVNAAVDKAFGEYTTLTNKDVEDSINIWSNNKWFGASQNNSDVSYVSKIEKINVTPNGEDKNKKWTIDFTYKFQIVTKVGDKTENVLAEKTYSVKDSDLATNKGVVDFTTKATLLMVDGKSMLDNKDGKTFYSNETRAEESKVVQDVKKFLNDGTSKFDAKVVFKEYVKNHEIKGEQVQTLIAPSWDEEKIKKENGVTLNLDKNKPTELSMTLTTTPNKDWGSCVTTTEYAKVKSTFEKYQNKIKSLVSSSDYDISTLEYGPELKGEKSSDMDITIKFKKKASVEGEDKQPTLIFKVKGFKKSA